MTIKKLLLSVTIASAMASAWAFAEDAKPDNQVSYNLSVTSDYRYRGISQSRLKPALQGGIDYTNNPSGFYAGAWASTITWIKDAGGRGRVELDLYAGFRGNVTENITFDVGVLSYNYQNNQLGEVQGFANANTTEGYVQFGAGPMYVKYSQSITNLFGTPYSTPSGYLDIGGNIPMAEKWTLNVHGGHQGVKGWIGGSYSDFKLGVTYDIGSGASAAFAIVGTDVKDGSYPSPSGQNLGRTGVVATLTKTF